MNNIPVITDKKILYDKCENMEQLFDKYYLPLLDKHYSKVYQLEQENHELKKQYCERTDCGGRLGNSKKVEELIKENEKLNHYKLLYQKVKERNDKAIEYIETAEPNYKDLHSMFLDSEYISNYGACELLEILKGNNEEQ